MFSKKLLGTVVLIAAAVGVPGSATARGSERAVGSFSADETAILAATSLDSAVTSDQEALGTRAGGEVGARIHILAFGTTHSAARRDIDYIDDTLGSGLRGTTDKSSAVRSGRRSKTVTRCSPLHILYRTEGSHEALSLAA